ncbi:OLC1v1037039C1, partial [Oldenlandia corymbosa var. corymbosa]
LKTNLRLATELVKPLCNGWRSGLGTQSFGLMADDWDYQIRKSGSGVRGRRRVPLERRQSSGPMCHIQIWIKSSRYVPVKTRVVEATSSVAAFGMCGWRRRPVCGRRRVAVTAAEAASLVIWREAKTGWRQ